MPANWDAAIAGRTAIREVCETFCGEDRLSRKGPLARIADLDAEPLARFPLQVHRLDPVALYALLATNEALADSGLHDDPRILADACLVYGAASGGNATIEEGYSRLFLRGATNVYPLTIPKRMSSAVVSHISICFKVRGLSLCVASACASSSHAIAEGMHLIRAGRARVVIAGGAEASLTYGALAGWDSLGALALDTLRPFSTGRRGTVLGEGAVTVVLEDLEHAAARGANVYAELAGAGASSDAYDLTRPSMEGAAAALRQAHADAALLADTPLLISAHGTGTPLNDKTETEALRQVCGSALARSHVIATKSSHGHMLGAAGAMGFVLGLLALRQERAPPVLNYLGADPECDLPLVMTAHTEIFAEALVANAFAFGGLNSVLIAKRLD